jgi:hypothetical protein
MSITRKLWGLAATVAVSTSIYAGGEAAYNDYEAVSLMPTEQYYLDEHDVATASKYADWIGYYTDRETEDILYALVVLGGTAIGSVVALIDASKRNNPNSN